MSRERIEYLDLIKACSIVFVVFCHSALLPKDTFVGNMLMTLAWGAVPCFFMVTGGLMHQANSFKWNKYFKKFLKTYLVLCMWRVIYFGYFNMSEVVECTKVQWNEFIFLFSDIDGVPTGPMWFMYAFLIALLFYPVSFLLFKCGKEGEKVLGFVVVLLAIKGIFLYSIVFVCGKITNITGYSFPDLRLVDKLIPFGNYTNTMVYFISGAFLLKYKECILNLLNSRKYLKSIPEVMIICGCLGLVFIKYYQTGSFYWNNVYLKKGYNWISTGVMAIGMYLFLLMKKPDKGTHLFAKHIGKATMGIYYLHYLLLDAFTKTIFSGLEARYSVALNTFKTILVICCCLLITNIIKRIPILKVLVM